jgi:hypothetical protein
VRRSKENASGNPELTLLDRRDEILTILQSVQKYRVDPKTEIERPNRLDIDAYLDKRITGPKGQIKYFTYKANTYAKIQKRLNAVEFLLALIAALLGAALTMTGKQAYSAWVAVITTITRRECLETT